METIYCKGSKEVLPPEPDKIEATLRFLHSRPDLLHGLSFLEQRAVNLKVEGHLAEIDLEIAENRNRRERLHNEFGHLVP